MPHRVLPANEKQMSFSSPFVSGIALQLQQTLAGHSGGRPTQRSRTKWYGCGHPAALKEAGQQETRAREDQRPGQALWLPKAPEGTIGLAGLTLA